MKHYKSLLEYNRNGLCALPCDLAAKFPKMIGGWRKYMTDHPTESELNFWRCYADDQKYGVCLICGKISGNLEVIDIDNHLDNAKDIFAEFISIDEVSQIIGKHDIPIETTKSGGYHIFYRCETIEGNQKLAVDQKTAVIETRGEGGLIVCAPSKGYELNSGDLSNIPIISTDERRILLSYCKAFDRSDAYDQQLGSQTHDQSQKSDAQPEITERPGDLYNAKYGEEAKSILESAGWKHIGGKYWRRPGKKDGVSASWGHVAPDVFYVFSSNCTPFESGHAYKPFDILVRLKYNGNVKEATLHAAQRLGIAYETRTATLSDPRTGPRTAPIPESKQSTKTWEIWYMGKKGAIKIAHNILKDFLQHNGFYRYEINKDKFLFVQIENNIVTERNFLYVRDFVLNYLLEINEPLVYNSFMDSSKFNSNTLSIIDSVKINWMRDTKDECFIFYRNTVVSVTRESGIKCLNYSDVNGMVWNTQIVQRDFKLDRNFDDCNASRFSKIVSDNSEDRISAYKSSLGYMIHGFKKASFCPVIVFNDENTTDEPTGGTGKGLSVKFVEQIRNVVTIDGKSFDTKNQFSLQRVSQDTHIIFLDDIARGFNFESLFSMITTGIPIRKLYLGEIFLPFCDSPKIVITTNYAIKSKGDSFTRRMFEIEIHKYFTPNLTPTDEFGKEPFTEWDDEEWCKFDNFMVDCVKHYLLVGLSRPEYITLKFNKLKADTHTDFVIFAEDNLQNNRTYNKREMLSKFREMTDDAYYRSNLGARKFVDWCEAWAKYKGWDFDRSCGQAKEHFRFTTPGVEGEVKEFTSVDELEF